MKSREAQELGRNSYGFEIDKKFYSQAKEKMLSNTSKFKEITMDEYLSKVGD